MAKRAKSVLTRGAGTRERVIEVARSMMQQRGFNGFSYNDVAAAVGVSHVAVHHHFKAKSDLGAAAMADYGRTFTEALTDAERRHPDAAGRLKAFMELFRRVLDEGDRLCLCGMLASEYVTLPESIRAEVRSFFERSEAWLAHVLEDGRERGQLSFDESPKVVAEALLASLEGALISARTFGDARRFVTASEWLVSGLTRSARQPVASGKKR